MASKRNAAVGFIFITLLVIAHELGHFFAARRNGVEVEEFDDVGRIAGGEAF